MIFLTYSFTLVMIGVAVAAILCLGLLLGFIGGWRLGWDAATSEIFSERGKRDDK